MCHTPTILDRNAAGPAVATTRSDPDQLYAPKQTTTLMNDQRAHHISSSKPRRKTRFQGKHQTARAYMFMRAASASGRPVATSSVHLGMQLPVRPPFERVMLHRAAESISTACSVLLAPLLRLQSISCRNGGPICVAAI